MNHSHITAATQRSSAIFQVLAAVLLAFVLVMLSTPSMARADSPHSLFTGRQSAVQCQQYRSSRQFVRESMVSCLDERPSRRGHCRQEARKIYRQCGFNEDFDVALKKIEGQMVMLSLFGSFVSSQPRDQAAAAGQKNSQGI